MRILVTGSSGFLGHHVVHALRDYRVHGIGRLGRLDVEGFDCVIHLAAQTEIGRATADPAETMDANVAGTMKVLDACRKAGTKRVIIASSDKCYGDGPTPYIETQPLKPHGVYAASKACADMIAQSYIREYGMSIAITRCANLYGPGHLNWTTLIPGTIRSVLRGERPVLRSDGSMIREWLYVEDAAEAYCRLVFSNLVGPVNLGGDKRSVLEVATAIVQQCGREDLPPDIQKTATTRNEIQEQTMLSLRAARELEWTPTRTIGEGLELTIPWYREFLKG